MVNQIHSEGVHGGGERVILHDYRHLGQRWAVYGAALATQPAAVADPSGGTDISCLVYHSVDQAIPNNTYTTLTFDSEVYDTDGMHDPAVNPSRLTIQTAGKYMIWATGAWEAHGTGDRLVQIRSNGTRLEALNQVRSAAMGNTINGAIQVVALDVGDYLEAEVRQTRGGWLDFEWSDRGTLGAALMSVVDVEARAAVADLLAKLRTLGIIAT